MGQEIGPDLKRADAFDKATLVLCFLYFAAVSLTTHAIGKPVVGFVLLPLPLLFFRLTSVRFMVLALACWLLFFEAFQPGSSFLFFNTPDSLFAIFVILRLFFRREFLSLRLPTSGVLFPLYLFLLDAAIMTIPGFLQYGMDYYVFRDFKNILYLGLVVIFCRGDEPLFGPKTLYRVLLAFILFSSGHALVTLLKFLGDGFRPITWNEVFLADAILMIVALLPITRNPAARRLLFLALPISVLGLLATQTRGLWGSTLAALLFYVALRMTKARVISFAKMFKTLQVILVFLVLSEALMRLSIGMGLFEFIHMRTTSFAPQELVDPGSSLGYRIHESLVVWEKRSWFGHGSGARVYLYFTQLGNSKFINWWSIHSEYFELLHKYGFVGLGLFMWFLAALMIRARRMAFHGNAFVSAMGFLVLTTILNHALVSVTSGYLIRENVMLYLVLMVGIVERFHPRVLVSRLRAARGNRPSGPARSALPAAEREAA